MLSVLNAGHDLSLGRAVAGQLVGDHRPRGSAPLFQQLTEQTLGGSRIAPALPQDVQHNPALIHGPPEMG
jgi:hypothetical protein